MKALIFNSGLGSRMGGLTRNNPKSMVRLGYGETLFERQLRILFSCGIDTFVVTTGPFSEQLHEVAQPYIQRGCRFHFVHNGEYRDTNYIYSLYLARDLLRDDDILMLHGDLAFDRSYVRKLLGAAQGSWAAVDEDAPLPSKDFKARVSDGRITEVSIGIFDDDCVAFQPLYRLDRKDMGIWLKAVDRFVQAGKTGVYAEEAANEVFGSMGVRAFSYAGHFVEEVDTPEDLRRVSKGIDALDAAQQPVYQAGRSDLDLLRGASLSDDDGAENWSSLCARLKIGHPLVVCAGFVGDTEIEARLGAACDGWERFSDFDPNPAYDQALAALSLYRERGCDSLVAIGGGSAIDVAKCVKMFSSQSLEADASSYLEVPTEFSNVALVAVPTTAGTGSESTRFAVIYFEGKKFSISHACLHPDAAVLDAGLLSSLPLYQKKCALLDALCQAIESYWSARSCDASRAYSAAAIPQIMRYASAYFEGDVDAAEKVLAAANLAGKAIDLTTTTAAHAMSYKITSMRGTPHGHAVALCLPGCWSKLLENASSRSDAGLFQSLSDLSGFMGCTAGDPREGLARFRRFFGQCDMGSFKEFSSAELDDLVSSVNAQRLANFPVSLSSAEIRRIYESIGS